MPNEAQQRVEAARAALEVELRAFGEAFVSWADGGDMAGAWVRTLAAIVAYAQAEGRRQALEVLVEAQRIYEADPDGWRYSSPQFCLLPIRAAILAGQFGEAE
jgi:hypothetical protein